MKKNAQPLITIITATYNLIKNKREQCFQQCVEMIQNQTYHNIEHIIIDGASNDGTLKFLKTFEKKGQIKVYSEPDKGIYDAFNKGLHYAKGKYIAFMGSDDTYAGNDIIEKMVNKLEETQSDWLYGDAYYVTSDKIYLWKGKESYLIFGCSPCHQSTMCSTKALLSIGGFVLNLVSADILLMLSLVVNNYKSCYLGEVLSIFSTEGESSKYKYDSDEYRQLFSQNFYNVIKDKLSLTLEDCEQLYQGKCYQTMSCFELINLAKKLKYSCWIKGLIEKDMIAFTKMVNEINPRITKYNRLSSGQINRRILLYKFLRNITKNNKYNIKIDLLKKLKENG